jgi:exopolysaccharide biosynthesis polyprenyl glycosylphosphotransferase
LTKRTPNHIGLVAIDSLVALTITVFIVMAPHHPVAALHPLAALRQLSPLRVRFVDAAFGVYFVLMWQYCFSVLNLYDKFATIPSKMKATFKGVAVMTLSVVLHLKIFHPPGLTMHSALFVMAALFCYQIDRTALSDHLLDRLAARDPQRVVILGSGRRASKAWREIRTRYYSSITLLGFVDDREPEEMPPDVAVRYRGRVDQLSEMLLNEVVDILLVAMPIRSCYPLMQRAIQIAEDVGVQVIYLQDIYSTRRQTKDMNQVIFRELVPVQERYLVRRAVKRVVDVCGAIIGMIVLSPVFLCTAIGVKLSSKGPVFFRQERYGYRRRRFRMIKFRSMVPNAEELLGGLEDANEAVGPIFKMRNDPRVTRFGRFIRSTSLDELPQLWNVLIGDMSLVGPRPMSVRDVSLFNEATLMRRFSVKPGITGLWQVNGRSEVGFDKWIEMDFSYIDEWSLLLDFKILARTVSTVVKRGGAM